MAIKIAGTTVVDDSRGLTNIASVDATTATAIGAAGVGGGGTHDFVASGTISNGDVVSLNADGTVSVTKETTTAESIGTATAFLASEAAYISPVYDSNSGKVVVIYRDNINSGYGTAVVGTVSGNSISFGTPVVFESVSTFYASATYDSNAQKIVVGYGSNFSSGKAIVGTVSGTSISFGTATTFNPANTSWVSCTFDSSNNKVVISYTDVGNSSQGTAIVGTVSGTSISFGTEAVFKNSTSDQIKSTFDSSNNKAVITYKNSSNGHAVVGTVSGTSISFGSEVTFLSGGFYGTGNVTFDSFNNKIVAAYNGTGGIGMQVIVGTVSGASISFGSATSVGTPGSVSSMGIGFDSNINKVVVTADNFSVNQGLIFTATVSATTVTATTPTAFEASNRARYPGLAYDTSNQKFALVYYNQGVPANSFGRTYKSTYSATNASSYIGVAAEDIADTATGEINIIGGVNEQTVDSYDLANASYDSVSFDVSAQETQPTGVFFKPDGTKMYIVGSIGDEVNEYNLSTAWDISTASFSQTFSVSSQDVAPQGIFFKPDGTKMYMTGSFNDEVSEYNLSTAWDISTASYSQNFDVSSQEPAPKGVFFKADGTKMYVVGVINEVYEYDLSTAWDISTASYLQNFSVAAQEQNTQGLFFKPDGIKMFVVGASVSSVYEYSLSTAWDTSTATYVQNFSVYAQDSTPNGVFFKPDGTNMYVVGLSNDTVYQYSVGTFGGYTTNSSYFVADDGTLTTTNNGRKIGKALSAAELQVKTKLTGSEMNEYLGGLV